MSHTRDYFKCLLNVIEGFNIRLNKCAIFFARNCVVTLENPIGRIEKGQIVFLEKHLDFRMRIQDFTKGGDYDYIELEKEDIDNVLKIMEPMYGFSQTSASLPCEREKRFFIIEEDIMAHSLFSKIKQQNKDVRRKAYEVACLLSMSEAVDKIFISLARSVTTHFRDRVRKLIESDTTKKWQLSLVSDEMNISEVAIRKKLESEQTTFYQILMDVRMQKAASLILKNDFQVGKISKMVGISSPSYFTKLFSSYYGVTPKSYFAYHKGIVFNTPFITPIKNDGKLE